MINELTFIIFMTCLAIILGAVLKIWIEEKSNEIELAETRKRWEREGVARLQASVENAEETSSTGSTGFH